MENLPANSLNRFRREWEVDNRQADENYPPKWLYNRRASVVSVDDLQKFGGLCESPGDGAPKV